MPKILIPTPLRQFADKKDAVEVAGATVGEALAALTTAHPDMKKNLFNDEGKLRSFVNVYLGEDDVRHLPQGDGTPLRDGDALTIVPSIAGGAR